MTTAMGKRGSGHRYAVRLFVFAALLAGLVSGCGFQLRGSAQLVFDSVFLNWSTNSPLRAELARNLRASSTTRVVESADNAAAIVDLIAEVRDREVLSLNAQGRAREYQLRYRIAFRLHDGKGHELIGPTELQAQRDILFNDSQVLAKESEEALLYKDMQSDIVQQLLRRLARAKPYVATELELQSSLPLAPPLAFPLALPSALTVAFISLIAPAHASEPPHATAR